MDLHQGWSVARTNGDAAEAHLHWSHNHSQS